MSFGYLLIILCLNIDIIKYIGTVRDFCEFDKVLQDLYQQIDTFMKVLLNLRVFLLEIIYMFHLGADIAR